MLNCSLWTAVSHRSLPCPGERGWCGGCVLWRLSLIGWDGRQTVVGPVCWAVRSRCNLWPVVQSISSLQRWVPLGGSHSGRLVLFSWAQEWWWLSWSTWVWRTGPETGWILLWMDARWSAHSLRTCPLIPSCPAFCLGFHTHLLEMYFGKWTYWLSCRELDEKIATNVCMVTKWKRGKRPALLCPKVTQSSYQHL